MVENRWNREEEMGWGSFMEKGQDLLTAEEKEGGARGQEEKGKVQNYIVSY